MTKIAFPMRNVQEEFVRQCVTLMIFVVLIKFAKIDFVNLVAEATPLVNITKHVSTTGVKVNNRVLLDLPVFYSLIFRSL